MRIAFTATKRETKYGSSGDEVVFTSASYSCYLESYCLSKQTSLAFSFLFRFFFSRFSPYTFSLKNDSNGFVICSKENACGSIGFAFDSNHKRCVSIEKMNRSNGNDVRSIENVSGSISFAFDSNHKRCVSIEKMNRSNGNDVRSIENVCGSIGFVFDSNHKSCVSIEKMSCSIGCECYSIEENCEKLMFLFYQRDSKAQRFFLSQHFIFLPIFERNSI
jgi:hypothetical protein